MGLLSSVLSSVTGPILSAVAGPVIKGFTSFLGLKQDQRQYDDQSQRSDEQFALNYKLQDELAKKGVRWKVEDAKAAGIHPAVALGVNPTASPVYGQLPERTNFARYGENISRAINSATTKLEKVFNTQQIKAAKLNNTEKEIDIALKLKELEGMGAPSFPEFATGEPGGDDTVRINPAEQIVQSRPGVEAGTPAATKERRLEGGWLFSTLTQDASEPIESDTFAWGQYNVMYKMPRYFKAYVKRPKYPATKPRKGYMWIYSKFRGMWKEVTIKEALKIGQATIIARERNSMKHRFRSRKGGASGSW